MNYQKIVCWGDSQTFGARTYGCYPLHLGRLLNQRTRYAWHVQNLSTNGHTARDLWFRLPGEVTSLTDVYQACVLIGTNDVGSASPLDLFEEYYSQILMALKLNGFRAVFCGDLPPIWPDGHAFFPADCELRREDYASRVRKVVTQYDIASLVDLSSLTADHYTDPVHLNEAGNELVAECFADAIVNR